MALKNVYLAQQKQMCSSNRKIRQHKINVKKLKTGLLALYDIWPRNGLLLFFSLGDSMGHSQVSERVAA